jgi:hypothetical protein
MGFGPVIVGGIQIYASRTRSPLKFISNGLSTQRYGFYTKVTGNIVDYDV